MAERTGVIKSGLFRLTGGRMVTRGEEVTMSEADYERALAADAVVESHADLTVHGELPEFPEDGDLSERASWMRSATIADIQAAVDENPALAEHLAAAELLRGSEARSDVLNLLEGTDGTGDDEETADPGQGSGPADNEVDLNDMDAVEVYQWVAGAEGDEQLARAKRGLEAEQAKGQDADDELVNALTAIVEEHEPPAGGTDSTGAPAPADDPLDISLNMPGVIGWVDRAGDDPADRLARAEEALAAEQAKGSDARSTLVSDLEATIAAAQAAVAEGK